MRPRNEPKPVKAPAFQMYASDFLTDTTEMTVCEVGAYIRLLLNQWVNGSLPPDPMRLAFIAGMDTKEFAVAWDTIKLKFMINEEGRLCNKRLETVRAAQKAWKKKRQEIGTEAAEKRWNPKDGEKYGAMPNNSATTEPIEEAKDASKITKKVTRTRKAKNEEPINYIWESTDFVLAWESWLIHKKKINNKYKHNQSENGAIKSLYTMVNGNLAYAVDCIQLSINSGWLGIYSNRTIDKKYGDYSNNQGGDKPAYNPNDLSKLNELSKNSDKS